MKPTMSNDKSGYVYVIHETEANLYKIGITANMERRMRELKVGINATLIEHAHYPNARKIEALMHQMYSERRIAQTEYFKLAEAPKLPKLEAPAPKPVEAPAPKPIPIALGEFALRQSCPEYYRLRQHLVAAPAPAPRPVAAPAPAPRPVAAPGKPIPPFSWVLFAGLILVPLAIVVPASIRGVMDQAAAMDRRDAMVETCQQRAGINPAKHSQSSDPQISRFVDCLSDLDPPY